MRAILAALLCLCACQSAAGQAIPLRYGQAYSALRSIFALPLLVAEREGYFVREGLDFSMLPVPGGGEKLIAALHDGTADIGKCRVDKCKLFWFDLAVARTFDFIEEPA